MVFEEGYRLHKTIFSEGAEGQSELAVVSEAPLLAVMITCTYLLQTLSLRVE